MATRPTNKVVLSFNSGEYSPFMDSRSDIEKAAQAARKLRNMQALTGGEARRRPGLRFVDEIPAPPVFADDNYIEMPFTFFTRSLVSVLDDMRFRGTIRLWESGTVELDGEANTSNPSGRTWHVATGPDTGTLTNHLVGTIPYGGTTTVDTGSFTSLTWSYKLVAGDYLFFYAGGDDGWGEWMRLVDYSAGGWLFDGGSLNRDAIGGSGGMMDVNFERSGNDIVMAGNASAGPAINSNCGIFSWEVDSTDWSLANFISHGPGVVLSTLVTPFSYSRTIPDSATIGLEFYYGVTEAAVTSGIIRFGPIFRPAYAPVVQQGVDPLG